MHAATVLLALVIGQDFSTEVRPILAARCFTCHGPDAAQREADLRLDRAESATAVLPSGRAAIVPFEVEESELVRRIFAADAENAAIPRIRILHVRGRVAGHGQHVVPVEA